MKLSRIQDSLLLLLGFGLERSDLMAFFVIKGVIKNCI